jgi:hypothetical protein
MTEAQPEARKHGDLYLKILFENAHMLYAMVHSPGCRLHGQMMWVDRPFWNSLERVG